MRFARLHFVKLRNASIDLKKAAAMCIMSKNFVKYISNLPILRYLTFEIPVACDLKYIYKLGTNQTVYWQ